MQSEAVFTFFFFGPFKTGILFFCWHGVGPVGEGAGDGDGDGEGEGDGEGDGDGEGEGDGTGDGAGAEQRSDGMDVGFHASVAASQMALLSPDPLSQV